MSGISCGRWVHSKAKIRRYIEATFISSKKPQSIPPNLSLLIRPCRFREPRLSRLDRKKLNKEKPMTLRDYEQKLILERGGQLSDDDDQKEEAGPSYTEQEAQLKQE